MIYQRLLNLPVLLENKSFFLFGPRSTGKTSLIKKDLKDVKVYDLLDAETLAGLARRSKILEEDFLAAKESSSPYQIIVIDEIQKLPALLDEVHRILNEHLEVKFLLTGSSARKLKRSGVNLLAGRAWKSELFPLTYKEIDNFDLVTYLNTGGLPHIYKNKHAGEELRSYVATYLKEEIHNESLVRNLPAFSSFFDTVALSNGEEISYQSLSQESGVSASTLKNYFQILEDTLLGFSLPGFTKTKKRKAIGRAKHFLFDIGVVNELCRRGEIKEKSELFGNAFEHFIILETRSWNSYSRNFYPLNYWRSTSKFEVDLIIASKVGVEIKATDLAQDKHLKGLRALKEEGLMEKYILVSNDREQRRTKDGIDIYPWQKFLDELWSGKIV